MKKIEKLGTSSIKKIVKEHFNDEDFLLPEDKIDSIIKEYILERKEGSDKKIFSPKSIEVIDDVILILNEIIEDLEILKEKEGDILIYKNKYADEFFEKYINNTSKLVRGLSNLLETNKRNKSNNNLNEI